MRRLVIFGLVIAALFAAAPSWAQRDRMQMGEALTGKVIRGTPGAPEETFAVEVAPDPVKGAKGVTGDLEYRKLPQHIRAALGFLVRWGKGPSTVTVRATPDPATPVLVKSGGSVQTYVLKDVKLAPPISSLQAVRNAAGDVEAVSVASMAVVTPASAAVKGRGVLSMRKEPDGWFTVTSVVVEGQ